ncbi:CotH kinase family protein [Pseudobacteriovorax antillogorgiicola]|uniref:CotH protein n=1 Tax=Pseudobacteriovorax antillogorgiicola TaxID=1513793 RepID=A0A1Y6CA78_9BACT|nr:CotH kinase family protein [Pseudobacteriovorax antillogorgiicola]TCS49778.1 CotH protein [Pseudobacteriovorax antillogorgiicola]SMF42801.1 CotH protein [Pseudobacteriovorax antillogorgiicola]
MKHLGFILTLFIFSACGDDDELKNYGLPVINLVIEADERSKMESALTEKIQASAALQIEGQWKEIKVSYSGKSSLFHPKRSYKVQIADGTEYQGLDRFRLSAQGSDKSGLRSLIGFEVFREQGLIAPRQFPIALYLNQRFQGLYHVIEEVDEEFFGTRGVTAEQVYKARYGRLGHANFELKNLNDLSLGFKVVLGEKRYDPLEEMIAVIQEPTIQLNAIDEVLDRVNYLNYLASAAFLNHWDGYNNNFFVYWDRTKLRFAPWDLDHIGEPSSYYDQAYRGKNDLSKALLSFSEAEEQFLQILLEMTSDQRKQKIRDRILFYGDQVRTAYEQDPYLSNYDFDSELQILLDSLDRWQAAIRQDIESNSATL